MAHMWFGDLVTMRWWDDLWLKESFADFMGCLALAEATEYREAWTTFAIRRKAWAYLQDQLPTTHPIVADVPDVEAAKLNFDGITYAKGASVLKQLVAYVGRDAFVSGVRDYIRAYAYGNATLLEFLTALEKASGRDLTGWSSAWLETSGLGTLSLGLSADPAGVVTAAELRQALQVRAGPPTGRMSSPSAPSTSSTAPSAGHTGSRSTWPATAPRCPAWWDRPCRTWSWSTTTTSPMRRSCSTGGPRPRPPVSWERSPTPCRGRWCGRLSGTRSVTAWYPRGS
jgi:hypothetical protein